MRSRFVAASLLCAATAACQTYDFSPVEPLAVSQVSFSETIAARAAPPEVVLVIDRSGSMNEPLDSSCTTAGCPTRWSALREALVSALPSLTATAQVGALFYPRAGAQVCELPSMDADFLAPRENGATEAILAAVDAHAPGGGTPTSPALVQLSDWFAANASERKRYVALLTDGEPNCNAANSSDANVPSSGCECTVATCAGTSLHQLGCLDAAVTADALGRLMQDGIPTLVVGFGADLTTSRAKDVLNAMATAGGKPRACAADADCGAGDVCDAGLCGRRFYPAANAADLAEAISEVCETCDPCAVPLQAPVVDADLMSVLVDGERVAPGADTWRYDGSAVQFQGALCEQMKASTDLEPRHVEVRVAQPL